MTVQHPGYLPATFALAAPAGTTTRLTAALWTVSPRAERVRPPYPGSEIRAAAFLGDGSLALTVAVPPGKARQLWLTDAAGALRRAGSVEGPGGLAATPDGAGSPTSRANWDRSAVPGRRGRPGPPRCGSPGQTAAPARGATPSPRRRRAPGRRRLDAGRAGAPRRRATVGRGGATTRLRRVDAESGEARDLVSLPAEIVPGAYAWSPAGDRVVLLARTDRGAALCVLGLADGAFRYLADLEAGPPPPLPPAGWSPDGRRLRYTAPLPSRPAAGLLPLARRPRPASSSWSRRRHGPWRA